LYGRLKQLYFDANFAGSLGGINRFFAAAKVEIPELKRDEVRQFLLTQRSYQLHAPARRHYPRSRVFVRHPADLYQCDLMQVCMNVYTETIFHLVSFQVSALRQWNDGIQYLMTIIDVFTKYTWLISLKSKSAKEIAAALTTFFTTAPVPEHFQTDQISLDYNSRLNLILLKHFYL